MQFEHFGKNTCMALQPIVGVKSMIDILIIGDQEHEHGVPAEVM